MVRYRTYRVNVHFHPQPVFVAARNMGDAKREAMENVEVPDPDYKRTVVERFKEGGV